nr:F-box domain, leucine-rich repeat domain, L domain-like protein [Tanacetum cinerariifolium]
NEIDMYVEHFGYDIMDLAELERNEEQNHNSIESSDDEYYGSDDCKEIENVGFQTEGESVMIKNISTHDPFLNKLCSVRIMFRGTAEHHETETPLVDPDENQIDAVNKVQSGVHYPTFNPNIPWDKMEPTLGMRYETPYQLKFALVNYDVAHGYQLWYMKNNWREVLVYGGRNVEDGRCVAYLYCGIDLDLGVSHWLPGRPQKARIKTPCKSSSIHISRVGRTMTCINCWQKGHNRASCTTNPTPKLIVEKKQSGRKKQAVVGHYASRGRGRGRSIIGNEANGSEMGVISKASVEGKEVMEEEVQGMVEWLAVVVEEVVEKVADVLVVQEVVEWLG